MLKTRKPDPSYCNSSNYDKNPYVEIVTDERIIKGWESIIERLSDFLDGKINSKRIIVLETYHGTMDTELTEGIRRIDHSLFICTDNLFLEESKIKKLTQSDATDDPLFGYMTRLRMSNFFDPKKLEQARDKVARAKGTIIIYGLGASLLCENPTLLIYADMARWEIQQRFRQERITNLGLHNKKEVFSEKYKRGFFIDWRVCDRQKKGLFTKVDFYLDTNIENEPKLLPAETVQKGYDEVVKRPFRLVPFFDPGPWGGQWMKDVFELDQKAKNYAWCFDCVPEENSMLLKVKEETFELPSLNLVFEKPQELLGESVYSRFGDEFPIRFDLLDTMKGGNLSLQVHPTTEYIQEEFGMHYTQDESYYLLDAEEDAKVFIGIRNEIEPAQMMASLEEAQKGDSPFEAEKYIHSIPIKKHDHVLIPNGTVHCSGAGSMVLEISATPYIFTFKLWDWDRVGLDGKPRPINIQRGKKVINWSKNEHFVQEELINDIQLIAQGEGWREERTGLHRTEFIETRRHWFSKKVHHHTNQGVNVLNLVQGKEAIVESPSNDFKPFVIHFAETFIIPARVGAYTIRPFGISEGEEIATIKAFIRF